jgi:hypothetical protein
LRRRTVGLAAVGAALVVVVVAVNVRVDALERRAERDLADAARERGLREVSDVRFRYPFWVENAGLAARNTEPFPDGYGSLDVVLDGCPLRDINFSATPDTRSWWPHPVEVGDVRFQYEHTGPSASGTQGAPALLRIEFTTADELRGQLRRALGDGACPTGGAGGRGPIGLDTPAQPP